MPLLNPEKDSQAKSTLARTTTTTIKPFLNSVNTGEQNPSPAGSRSRGTTFEYVVRAAQNDRKPDIPVRTRVQNPDSPTEDYGVFSAF